MKLHERFHFVAKKFYPNRKLFIDGDNLHRVAPDPEHATFKRNVISLILHGHKRPGHVFTADGLPDLKRQHGVQIVFRSAQTVNTGHRGDNNHVSTGQQGVGCLMAKPFHFGVDGAVFFDEGVCLWNVGFRLVVVVIGHEVFDGVVGKHVAEFVSELGGKGFVVRQYQGGALQPLDQPRRCRRFSCSRRPQQSDIGFPGEDAGLKFI